MDWCRLTQMIMVTTVVLLVLYDVVARVFGGNDATISYQLMEASKKWPIIPAAIGLLVGHWFWQIK